LLGAELHESTGNPTFSKRFEIEGAISDEHRTVASISRSRPVGTMKVQATAKE
jgi:hypothetical protein